MLGHLFDGTLLKHTQDHTVNVSAQRFSNVGVRFPPAQTRFVAG